MPRTYINSFKEEGKRGKNKPGGKEQTYMYINVPEKIISVKTYGKNVQRKEEN